MENELDVLASKYGTDKCDSKHNYVKWYKWYFSNIRYEKLNILEIGIQKGYSLLTWNEYFKNSSIFGIDRKKRSGYDKELKGNGIKFFIGDGSDHNFLSTVVSIVKGGFDIIIDDASHNPSHQISSFEYLFPKLNDGGIYVIEDLQTSYFDEYVSKGVNAVDYFKNLLDDIKFNGKNRYYQNFEVIEEGVIKKATEYEKTIESIHFHMVICFIFKRGS